MRPQRKRFWFREDAIAWIKKSGFYYVDLFGWCHAEGFAAIVEMTGARPGSPPWALCVYKSAVPAKQENV